jgi:hypothetical protein
MEMKDNPIKTVKDNIASNYNGKYYPKLHQLGMRVPLGGSSCAKCEYLSEDKVHCKNKYFQRWRKDSGAARPDELPAPSDEYCCDLFET